MNTRVCPNCKLTSESHDNGDEPAKIFSKVLLRNSLLLLLPDLEELVGKLPPGEFQKHIELIFSSSLQDLDNEIVQQMLGEMQDLQLDEFSQPNEIARTHVFELFLELARQAPSIEELLNRPVLKALKISADAITQELERRALQTQLPEVQYRPLPALELDNEKSLVRHVLVYLATLDAVAGLPWQENFQRSLRDGEINEEEIECELLSWRQLLKSDMQPVRPDSPWRQTLRKHGAKFIAPPDERSFVYTATLAENKKYYSIAEDIARASLRLLDSSSHVGTTTGVTKQREKLRVLAQGVIATCCDPENVESEQSASQSAFYESVKQMILDTFLPKEFQNPVLLDCLKGMDCALDIAVADNLAKQKDRRQEAVLKYNRAIFAAKETIDSVRRKGYKATKEDTARAKVEQLLLIKSLTKLAEIKFQEEEFNTSEQYLLSAAKHLDDFDIYNKEQSFDALHSPLRPAIFGSLGLIYLHQEQWGRACRAFKRAKLALKSTQPLQMAGFMITYQGVIDEYEQLKSRLAS